jgi:leucyl/phenylalanyl-tRNA--protein transferase
MTIKSIRPRTSSSQVEFLHSPSAKGCYGSLKVVRPTEPTPSRLRFPDPRTGVGREGIVCVGGDFSPGTLLTAYRSGIFPWPMSEKLVPWCSPDPRAIFPLDPVPHWSRSLLRTMKRGIFRVSVDKAFADVLAGCSDRDEGTWITDELASGYKELHRLGWAHSVEVWNAATGDLVGGIYGLAMGGFFAGESMFHRETDASKVAFATLVRCLQHAGFELFDAQVMTPHLASLGCVAIPRRDFLNELMRARGVNRTFPSDIPESPGA